MVFGSLPSFVALMSFLLSFEELTSIVLSLSSLVTRPRLLLSGAGWSSCSLCLPFISASLVGSRLAAFSSDSMCRVSPFVF